MNDKLFLIPLFLWILIIVGFFPGLLRYANFLGFFMLIVFGISLYFVHA